ncbi:MAG: chemotaxis protein CheC [Actinobacteria bacterium]|nr:chemotaxis protein CheC [Actinomycetota bacterium]
MPSNVNFGEFALDALRETGNIGAGHAATSLSRLMDRKILILVPHVKIIPPIKLPTEIIHEPEELIAGVYVRITGDIDGSTLFLMSEGSAKRMVSVLLGKSESTACLSDEGQHLLTRIGDIMISSYLDALSEFTGLKAAASEPSFSFDMGGALVEAVALELDLEAGFGILIQTRFIDNEDEIEGHIVFLPNPNALQTVLTKMGVH